MNDDIPKLEEDNEIWLCVCGHMKEIHGGRRTDPYCSGCALSSNDELRKNKAHVYEFGKKIILVTKESVVARDAKLAELLGSIGDTAYPLTKSAVTKIRIVLRVLRGGRP